MADYKETLEAAGAAVLVYEEFGSYQGDWLAKVNYNGEIFWIKDCFGSCSGCDSLKAEWGWSHEPTREELGNFGKHYLDDKHYTQAEIEKEVAKYIEWDRTAPEMLAYVKEYAIE